MHHAVRVSVATFARMSQSWTGVMIVRVVFIIRDIESVSFCTLTGVDGYLCHPVNAD